MSTNSKRKPMRPHWYKIYWGFCPVCGKPSKHRVRQYSYRPHHKSSWQRYVRIPTSEAYCGCEG